ncbi:MAG: peptide chain release factor N(5)-glutamine methyltransferase [Massiliimalia sp.]|jgi:release factor glutamine methyltransferase
MVIREACAKAAQALQKAGVESSLFEARQLVQGILNISPEQLLQGDISLSQEQEEQLSLWVERRISGYPLQYLLGEWEFFGLPFYVGEGVLIPRQDTETLCEQALSFLKGKREQKVIDLCSGSGCIAVAIDHYAPGNQVYALEKSLDAITYLKRNIARNQSQVIPVENDVLDPIPELTGFDLIVSNPPYLNQEEMESLQTEVTFEPEMALYADHDGYDFYEQITRIWKSRLNPGGMLAYEVGWRQAQKVMEILEENGMEQVQAIPDLCGVLRVVTGISPKTVANT